MPVCVPKRIKRRKLCSGDLDIYISLYDRSTGVPVNSVDFSQKFTLWNDVWAATETVDGVRTFYVTNINGDFQVTHVFYMRWIDGLTAEKWIRYQGINFDILQVENVEQRNQWAICYCNLRGVSSQAVNDA